MASRSTAPIASASSAAGGSASPIPQEQAAPPTDTVSAPITALLVGSGEGGVTLADSLQSLLRAVVRANQRLELAAGEKDAGRVR